MIISHLMSPPHLWAELCMFIVSSYAGYKIFPTVAYQSNHILWNQKELSLNHNGRKNIFANQLMHKWMDPQGKQVVNTQRVSTKIACIITHLFVIHILFLYLEYSAQLIFYWSFLFYLRLRAKSSRKLHLKPQILIHWAHKIQHILQAMNKYRNCYPRNLIKLPNSQMTMFCPLNFSMKQLLLLVFFSIP